MEQGARFAPPRWRPFASALCCLVAACSTNGQLRAGKPGTALERLSGHVAVGAEYKRTRQSGDFVAENTVIQEEAGFRAQGRLLDSRLLRYDLGLTLAFNQTKSTEVEEDFKNLFLPRYFGTLSMLEKHPTPITIYGRRDEDRFIQESQFTTQLIETIVNEFGGRVGLNGKSFGGSLEFRRSLLDTSGLDSGDRSTRRNEIRLVADHRATENITSKLTYWFDTFDEEFSSQSYETHTLNFFNKIQVGIRDQQPGIQFQTTLFTQDRAGTTNFTNVDFRENVEWMIDPYVFHSQTLFEHHTFDSSGSTRLNSIEQAFKHWLFRSLISRVYGSYADEKINDGGIRRAGAGLELRYLKRIGDGSLAVNYSYDFGRQDNDVAEGLQQVFDEPHTLAVTTVSLLAQPNVVESSVMVTDITGAVTYTVDIDYLLILRGDRTEIIRIPGGFIAEGQPVLVDYQYRTAADLTFDRENHAFSVEIFSKTLRVYARLGKLRQTPLEGDATEEFLENRDAQTIGAAYYNQTGARFGAEFRNVDSNFSPFQQALVNAGYTFGFGERTRLGIGATYTHTDLPDDEVQQTTAASLNFESRPVRNLTIRFQPTYRIERGRAPGLDRKVLDAFGEVRYDFGKFTVRWYVRHQSLDLESDNVGSVFTSILLSRKW